MRPVLRLFVTGQSPSSLAAIRNVREICAVAWAGDYALDIVDVLQSPQAAEEFGIIATPTLIRLEPAPMVRLIGNLNRHDQVLAALDANATPSAFDLAKQKALAFLMDDQQAS